MIARRQFITLLGGAAAAWPVVARGQQAVMPVIGFLSSEPPGLMAARLAAYREGLREAGYSEGGNVAVEYRWAEGRYEKLPAFVDELVRHRVAVIVANAPAVATAKAATKTIPIVFFTGLDPVKAGLVTSLNRPSGNLTGVSLLNTELVPKRIELLRELLPAAKLVALLVNPANPNAEIVKRDSETAARAVGLRLQVETAKSPQEFENAYAALVQARADALVLGPDPLFSNNSARLAELAMKHKLPSIYQFREFAANGGLMSYSGSIIEAYRQIGVYTGRILGGAKPGELPVQQLTKVELIVNLRTAKALDLTMPQSLLARADEVIE